MLHVAMYCLLLTQCSHIRSICRYALLKCGDDYMSCNTGVVYCAPTPRALPFVFCAAWLLSFCVVCSWPTLQIRWMRPRTSSRFSTFYTPFCLPKTCESFNIRTSLL